MIGLIAATCGGFLAGWICRGLQLPMVSPKSSYGYRHPGRNLPPPDLLPMPPAPGAQRIYRGAMWREKGNDVWHPLGVPWEEGHTQCGNGHGGPSTPKPPIKPQPSGGTTNPPPEAP